MSYDFAVHCAREPGDLAALVAADPSLSVAGRSGARTLVVRRTTRGTAPAFEVRGPFPVEPFDVPPAATALALGLRVVYAVGVPAPSAGAVAAAEQLAVRLAEAGKGVVLDRQPALGEEPGAEGDGEVVWPPESRRRYDAPPPGPVDVVRVDWYLRAADLPPALPAWWLELALRLLPEARPVAFGPTGPTGHTGPFTGRVARDGEDAFVRAWQAGPPRLGWSCRPPALEAEVTGRGPVRTLSLVVLRDALTDPRWRDALLALLAGVAEACGGFYASAQVLRGWTWDGERAEPGAAGERADDLAPGGTWLGLPPEPVWCAWLGAPYAHAVRPALTGSVLVTAGRGLLARQAEEPADRDALAALVPAGGRWERLAAALRLRRRRTWLPRELSAGRAGGAGGPLRPARVRPPGLGPDAAHGPAAPPPADLPEPGVAAAAGERPAAAEPAAPEPAAPVPPVTLPAAARRTAAGAGATLPRP